MGDDLPLVGMIPESSDIVDQFARVLNQGIIDGNHTSGAIPCLRVLLQPCSTPVVQRRRIPRGFCEPPIQTCLIGRDREFPLDPTDRLGLSKHESRQVFGNVLARWFGAKQVPKRR